MCLLISSEILLVATTLVVWLAVAVVTVAWLDATLDTCTGEVAGLSSRVSAISALVLLDLKSVPSEDLPYGFVWGLKGALVGESVGGILLGDFRGDLVGDFVGDT